MADDRLKIAVFIDFDNVEIGVKTTLGRNFDIGAVLEAVKERGEIITKVAYGDWKRADYGRAMSNHAVRLVQRVMTPGGDKNGADINLALDALEMAFTHDHINAFVIVGGDSDFITLVEKLKQYDKKVFVVGGRQFTSLVMQKNSHEFIAYENLVGVSRRATGTGGERRGGAPMGGVDVSKALPLVRRALKVRTIMNLLGPCLNPARPSVQLLGVAEEKLLRPIAETLRALGVGRALIVHGSGLDEIALHGPTRAILVSAERLEEIEITPEQAELKPQPLERIIGGSPLENAKRLAALLAGRGPEADTSVVTINAGALLMTAGKARDLREGVALAQDAISFGTAHRLLRDFIEATNA